MKILIIGNGFDLAHDLPTKYYDFLKVCKASKAYRVFWDEKNPELFPEDINENPEGEQSLYAFCQYVGADKYDVFRNIVKDSFWINHFIEREKQMGDTWGGFEEEIRRVVMILNNEKLETTDGVYRKSSLRNLYRFINDKKLSRISYKRLFQLLLEDHKSLLMAMDIYFGCYVDNIEVEVYVLI